MTKGNVFDTQDLVGQLANLKGKSVHVKSVILEMKPPVQVAEQVGGQYFMYKRPTPISGSPHFDQSVV
jgi:hypothetical protein